MMKTLLIALALLLLIPNFINKDINESYTYDHKERYNPQLARINSIEKLEAYVDSVASQTKITTGSHEYTVILAYIISCRFYHGFSHWKLNENWIAALGEKVTGVGLSCKVQPEAIMHHDYAACSQQALVMMEILRRKQMSYRKVGFPHHYALEVQMGNEWYFFDPNMEPKISFEERAHSNWKGNDDLLKKYYSTVNHPNLDYQFGKGQMAEFGPVNEIPAKRVSFFQVFTSGLSKCLWLLPLTLAFVKRRRPYMYPVKPINRGFKPTHGRGTAPLSYA